MRDIIYQAALLHDIGKFIERARLPEWQEKARSYLTQVSRTYAHRRFSAAFIDAFAPEKRFLHPEAASFVLLHHRGDEPDKQDYFSWNDQSVELNIIRIADDCASSERIEEKTLKPLDYRRARILSPFSQVTLSGKNTSPIPSYIPLRPLDIQREAGFPYPEAEEPPGAYESLVRAFLDDFKKIQSEEELFFLMEKYLHAVPAQTPVQIGESLYLYTPDINLFDHSRTVAAIALCLYDAYTRGPWKGQDRAIRQRDFDALEPPILLITGDVSGIQPFIFSIPSKGAARALKGRSFFVQAYTDVVVRYILDRLNLKEASVLYNGGGNFYILAPAQCESTLKEIRHTLEQQLLQRGIYLGLAWVPVHVTDFTGKSGEHPSGERSRFAEKWQEAHRAVDRQKRTRFQSLPVEQVFTPFREERPTNTTDPFVDLTNKLAGARGYGLGPAGKYPPQWEHLIHALGYHLSFVEQPSREAYLFNDTAFAGAWRGFRFTVKDLPRYRDLPRIPGTASPEQIIDFDHLAQCAEQRTGTAKLGVLKMDVDNLGQIFTSGLPEKLRTIARIAALSRFLKWFFEGYMNTLLKQERFSWIDQNGVRQETTFWPNIYPIFSGGDDFFIVGAWDAVFAFARRVHQDFTAFVHNPDITLSASLFVIDERYPVSRFASVAEERLEQAKQVSPDKNRIHVFDRILTWEAFNKAHREYEHLLDLVRRGESRALIQRVLRIALNMEEIVRDASEIKRIRRFPRIWRIHYYLTRNIRNKDNQPIIEHVIEQFEQMVAQALMQQTTETPLSPAVFTVAARWAELASRTIPEHEEVSS